MEWFCGYLGVVCHMRTERTTSKTDILRSNVIGKMLKMNDLLAHPPPETREGVTCHIKQKFVEKYLKTKSINSEKNCIFAVTK